MQMATSFWTQFNPDIKQKETVKRYFNHYLYKLVITADGGRSILGDGDASFEFLLDKRIQELTLFKIYRPDFWVREIQRLKNANIPLLELLRTLHRSHTNLKYRIEEPRIQVYATTEQELKDFVQYLGDYSSIVTEIHLASPESVNLLNDNAIIRRRDNGYRYKVMFRDSMLTPEAKENLARYLLELPTEQVYIPAGTRRMLTRQSRYIWNMFIYSNDLSLNTFVELICPGLILKNHELVVQPTKY
jgi:hypothetical protein